MPFRLSFRRLATRLLIALLVPVGTFAGCDCDGAKTGMASTGVILVVPAGEVDEFERKVDFGAVRVTTLATQDITLRNDGRATARITNVTMTKESPNFFLVGLEERPTLEAGATHSLKLRYVPSEIGSDTTTITIETDVDDTPKYTLVVNGSGAASDIEVCSTGIDDKEVCASETDDGTLVIDLGEVRPGSTSTRPLVVKNQGDATLNASRIATSSTTSIEYSISPETTSFNVAPQKNIRYDVTYSPFDGGEDEGAIEILSDDPKNPRVIVILRAAGLAPKLCIDPLAIDFGAQDVGSTAKKTLTLTSCGLESVDVTRLEPFSESDELGEPETFAITDSPSTPFTMAVGEQMELEVTYSPRKFSENEGQINVAYTTGTPTPKRGLIPLRGRGVGCTLIVMPSPVAFGAVSVGGRASKSVKVSNAGSGDCVISEITPPNAPFEIDEALQVPVTISPGQATQLDVFFGPTVNSGATSKVIFTSNDPRRNVEVPLAGNGIDPPPCDLQAQPSNLLFTNVSTGQTAQKNILLQNFGTDKCYVSKAETTPGSSPAYSAVLPGSTFQQAAVPPGGQLSVPIKFAPTSAGTHTGIMRFTYSDDDFPLPFPIGGSSSLKLDVPLEGGTLEPALCLDPSSLNFGMVSAGTSKEMTFDIKSCGAGALRIRGVMLATGSSLDYSIVSPPSLPTYLAAGQSLKVRVLYGPKTNSADFGEIAILTNDPNKPEGTVKLTGNGATSCGDRQLECSTDHLVFPTMEIGRGSSLSLTCRNVGTAPVTVTGTHFESGSSTEFKANVGSVPQAVPAGGAVRLEVTYLPQDAGNDIAAVVVDSDSCRPPRVSAEGSGKQPNYPACPPMQVFQPVEKWAWSGGTTNPSSKNVAMSPVVINLTDDNGDGRIDENDIPDLLFTSCKTGECCIDCMAVDDMGKADLSGKGMMRAVHGKDGRELWSVTNPSLVLTAMAQLAAGDIDGDNLPEIIAVKHHFQKGTGTMGMEGKYARGALLVFNHKGELLFETEEWTGETSTTEQSGAPTIGDIDGDGQVEIIFERTVFNSRGKRLFDMSASGNDGHGSFATLSDLDGNGQLEIVSGNKAYRANGALWWTAEKSDPGPNMILDIDGDGSPELILRDRSNRIQIFDALNGKKKFKSWEWTLPTNSEGQTEGICAAPMAAADLDGDGLPEIIVPSGDYVYAFKPMTGAMMWKQPIDDYGGQCGAAGAAAFDFEGDGKYEVVYHDTAHMYVFRGTDGTKIYDAPRNSSTIWETPVIADVDNDGHADLVMTNENGLAGIGGGHAGVKVLSNVGNTWPATRRIWNQHSYHVSDVNENGTIPRQETPHYKTTNSWRANHSKCVPVQ